MEPYQKPLQWWAKIMCFLIPGIFQVIYVSTINLENADEKLSDLKKWTQYGYGFYLILFVLILLFSIFIKFLID